MDKGKRGLENRVLGVSLPQMAVWFQVTCPLLSPSVSSSVTWRCWTTSPEKCLPVLKCYHATALWLTSDVVLRVDAWLRRVTADGNEKPAHGRREPPQKMKGAQEKEIGVSRQSFWSYKIGKDQTWKPKYLMAPPATCWAHEAQRKMEMGSLNQVFLIRLL